MENKGNMTMLQHRMSTWTLMQYTFNLVKGACYLQLVSPSTYFAKTKYNRMRIPFAGLENASFSLESKNFNRKRKVNHGVELWINKESEKLNKLS